MTSSPSERTGLEIAVVGMTGRFPKANSVDAFWENLRTGTEGIRFFSEEELKAAGLERRVYDRSEYVPARAVLDPSVYQAFDAGFFGISPREAEIIDPQHRLFLECAWEALERAACMPEEIDARIGVFASTEQSTYAWHNLASNPDVVRIMGRYQTQIGNSPEHLPTRVSYKLNLHGPSINVQTACSSSLVALHQACQSLLNGECDAALAGGSSLKFPHLRGHLYQPDSILSHDGHCRPFDAAATGTVGGCGVGVVVLKRLDDAEADGSLIHAVIRGTATNNDGARKVGYTAPSVQGQSDVITEAHQVAGVPPGTISYVEAHGTATELGDPIEVEALTQAFRRETQEVQFCALGSVKSNLGHLDAAAGVTGFIKTVLALKNKQVPPTLHYETPNPEIDFSASPFYVNSVCTDWRADAYPRRAGVSSFGIGGTNAHVVLEEAPSVERPAASQHASDATFHPYVVLPVSARSDAALNASMGRLADALERSGDESSAPLRIEDVSHTLQIGRRAFSHRAAVVASSCEEAARQLRSPAESQRHFDGPSPRVLFQLPGQGSQRVGVTKELYDTVSVVRDTVDDCARAFLPHLGFDLRAILYAESSDQEEASVRLRETAVTQPALFVTELAYVKLWESLGITPDAFIGHSIGELVAAHCAGVFSLSDACRIVAARGRRMQSLPSGSMLAIPVAESEARSYLTGDCSVAAINTPGSCVLSGQEEVIKAVASALDADGIPSTRLHTSHAFHSSMMDPMMDAFREDIASVDRSAPDVPIMSCVTGDWMTNAQAVDPEYWARHVRHPVRYADALATVMQDAPVVLVECGPGRTLSTLTKRHPDSATAPGSVISVASAPPSNTASGTERETLLTAVASLWKCGVDIAWDRLSGTKARRRVVLPTYPFQRTKYWIPARPSETAPSEDASGRLASSQGPTPEGGLSESVPPESDDLPLTSVASPSTNGSSRDTKYERPDLDTSYVAPKNDTEASIAAVWERVLGVAPIGRDDEFFSLGGDSLIATRISVRLREDFQAAVPAHVLYEDATVASIAAYITSHVEEHALPHTQAPGAQQTTSSSSSTPKWTEAQADPGRTSEGSSADVQTGGDAPLRPVSHDVPLPLSFSQERLWSIEQMQPGTSAYHMPFVVRIEGALDVHVLRACFRTIVQRHAVLRTTFPADTHPPRQIIHSSPDFPYAVVDVQGLEESAQEAALHAQSQRATGRPFDLSTGPILRICTFRCKPDDHLVVVTLHHIATDGWSTGILVQELRTLYRAYQNDVASPPLPPLPIQYADYAVWQRDRLDPDILDSGLDRIRQRLAGTANVCTLPEDYPRPAQQTYNGAELPVSIDAATVNRLRNLTARHEATLFMGLLAIYTVVLREALRTTDLVIGTDVAGRTRKATEPLVGMFVNQLPLRVTLDPDGTFLALLHTAKAATRDAYALQDIPFERVVDAVLQDRNPAYPPLFQVKLSLRNQPRTPLNISLSDEHAPSDASEDGEVLTLRFPEQATSRALVDIRLGLQFTPDGGLTGELAYNADLYRRRSVKPIVEGLRVVLDTVLETPGIALSDLQAHVTAQQSVAERQNIQEQVQDDLSLLRQTAQRSKPPTE